MAIKKVAKKAKNAEVVKTIDDMLNELTVKQNDLIEAKRGLRIGELTNTSVLRSTRKQIARLHTAIRVNMIDEAFASQRREDK